MDFFNKLGVQLKVERGERVFPESDKSSDIISAMQGELVKRGVHIKFNSTVKKLIVKSDVITGLQLEDNSVVSGDYFIICTGGLSYPRTGSTGDGLRFARELGHKIVEPKPALIPITVKEEWIKDLQGLSLKNVEFNITNEANKVLYSDFGEMLFTHFGISGPIVLSGSRVVNNHKALKAVINLKPALSSEELDKRIQSDFAKFTNKSFKNSLSELLPQKLIPVIIMLSGIDEDKKVNLITKDERKQLVKTMQNFTLTITGLRPIEEAIITSGGVDVRGIDPSTMQSKLINNLYFAGEVIDVDAYTGGFNIQIALSTGYLAGSKVGDQS
jgi:predicted Rossmann fold flavoprotein